MKINTIYYKVDIKRNEENQLSKNCIHIDDENVRFNGQKLLQLYVGGRYCTRYCPYNKELKPNELESNGHIMCEKGKEFKDFSPQLELQF